MNIVVVTTTKYAWSLKKQAAYVYASRETRMEEEGTRALAQQAKRAEW